MIGDHTARTMIKAVDVPKMPHVRRFLDLSTGHLTRATARRIERGESPSYMLTGEHGWMLYVPDDEVIEGDWGRDLLDVFDKARALECAYVLFDGDAEQLDDLPFYDEEW